VAVAKHPFLSDEWFAEVRRIHEARGDDAPSGVTIRMNLLVTGTPFGDKAIHMLSEEGRADWGDGHLENADVTLTLTYDVARDLFIGGNPQAGIEAFMAGKITVQGDITKLMLIQSAPVPPDAAELAKALQDITEL
jgi:hypothetical protein